MTAFDADIFTEIQAGHPGYCARASAIARDEQSLPVVVAVESLRGRLHAIRLAEAGKSKLSLEIAFNLFERGLREVAAFRILAYTTQADVLFNAWKKQKIRIGTQDLRIAAICVAHDAKLVSRNNRDFELVPGLNLEVWN